MNPYQHRFHRGEVYNNRPDSAQEQLNRVAYYNNAPGGTFHQPRFPAREYGRPYQEGSNVRGGYQDYYSTSQRGRNLQTRGYGYSMQGQSYHRRNWADDHFNRAREISGHLYQDNYERNPNPVFDTRLGHEFSASDEPPNQGRHVSQRQDFSDNPAIRSHQFPHASNSASSRGLHGKKFQRNRNLKYLSSSMPEKFQSLVITEASNSTFTEKRNEDQKTVLTSSNLSTSTIDCSGDGEVTSNVVKPSLCEEGNNKGNKTDWENDKVLKVSKDTCTYKNPDAVHHPKETAGNSCQEDSTYKTAMDKISHLNRSVGVGKIENEFKHGLKVQIMTSCIEQG